MRLHYQAGNRTAAIHQYETCVTALHKELDVGPARRTVALYRQICNEPIGVTPQRLHSNYTHATITANIERDPLQQLEQIQLAVRAIADAGELPTARSGAAKSLTNRHDAGSSLIHSSVC